MGDAPGAARFLGLGADMNLGFGSSRFLNVAGCSLGALTYSRCLISAGEISRLLLVAFSTGLPHSLVLLNGNLCDSSPRCGQKPERFVRVVQRSVPLARRVVGDKR